jgi:hypothetical protein
MRAPKKKPTAEKLRPWRVALKRSRAHYIGVVYAPDEVGEGCRHRRVKIAEDMRRLIVRPDDD